MNSSQFPKERFRHFRPTRWLIYWKMFPDFHPWLATLVFYLAVNVAVLVVVVVVGGAAVLVSEIPDSVIGPWGKVTVLPLFVLFFVTWYYRASGQRLGRIVGALWLVLSAMLLVDVVFLPVS